MHREETVKSALDLARSGWSATEIARGLGIPRSTVRDWTAGRVPRRSGRGTFRLRPAELSSLYAYLLGLYLGDGCLSAHPRGVFKLRVALDRKYPGIVEECVAAIQAVLDGVRVNVCLRPDSVAEVYAYSKAWPTLFPQHGPAPKHRRRIALHDWQRELVDLDPELFLRGLIHSDGCRAMNTGRGGWRHPRYSFSNRSDDIRALFCAACDRVGVRWTTAPDTVYVSRKADVARLDEFVGPKR